MHREDTNPKSPPRKGVPPPHWHLYRMNQNPYNCQYFWVPVPDNKGGGRLWFLFSLLATVAFQACEYPMSTRSERASIRDEIALIRSSESKTEVVTLLGEKSTRPSPSRVYSTAPDFGEHVVTRFDGSDLQFSFANRLPGAELYLAHRALSERSGQRAEIRWTSPDGSSLLLLDRYEGTLRHVCVCGGVV